MQLEYLALLAVFVAIIVFLSHVTHMRSERNKCYAIVYIVIELTDHEPVDIGTYIMDEETRYFVWFDGKLKWKGMFCHAFMLVSFCK